METLISLIHGTISPKSAAGFNALSLYIVDNCTPSSVNEFPDGFNIFTREQLLEGWISLYFLGSAYIFLVVALICESYFLPSVYCICEELKISPDVAGATFMAFATSVPEMCTSVIGVFITESDIGVGAIVGSAVFNLLGIAACTGLAAKQPILLQRWPVTRDTCIYIVAMITLVGIVWDGEVTLVESIIMLLLVVVYIIIMANNQRLRKFFRQLCSCKGSDKNELPDTDVSAGQTAYRPFFIKEVRLSTVTPPVLPEAPPSVPTPLSVIDRLPSDITDLSLRNPDEEPYSLLHPPVHSHWYGVLFWLLCWPALLLLKVTVPNCSKPKLRKFYPLTFFMSVVWIGIASYLASWMITIIGDTFHIVDSVMGLIFLAAGGCLPEAVSSFIMARRGEGSMSISNSLGNNTLDVLLSLGLPWLVKTIMLGGDTVHIQSDGMRFSLLMMLGLTIIYRWGLVAGFRRRVGKMFGATCLFFYVVYISIVIAIEMNVFGDVNGPTCGWD